MKKSLLLLAIILALPSLPVQAVRVPGLYEAEVPVSGQGTASRQEAVTEAMKLILVKLTGDRNAGERMELAPLIEGAERYVQQYRYVESPAPADPGASGLPVLRLRVSFDESNLDNALRNLGIQVWGRERPSTLIWVAMEQGDTRSIIHPEDESELFSVINQRARERGIVLIYPLFDLQDTASLKASDIWGGFDYPVTNASARYYPDLILTARVQSPLPGIWEGQWTLYMPEGKQLTFSTEGSYPESVYNEGIDTAADYIADRYAQGRMSEIGQSELKVIDIISLSQYASVLKYLQSLSPVAGVEVTQVSPGNVEFSVSAHGGEQALYQAIRFGRVLEPVGQGLNIYRLLP